MRDYERIDFSDGIKIIYDSPKSSEFAAYTVYEYMYDKNADDYESQMRRFVIVWDEPADYRVVEFIRRLHYDNALCDFSIFAFREGTLDVVLHDERTYSYSDKLIGCLGEELTDRATIGGDQWSVTILNDFGAKGRSLDWKYKGCATLKVGCKHLRAINIVFNLGLQDK